MIRYARAPSGSFRALLAPGGPLAPLLVPRKVGGLTLDVHFRERDHLHLYCGLTRVIDVSLVGGLVRVTAHDAYTSQACATDLFCRDWTTGDPAFGVALEQYLSGVAVHARHCAGEGAVQAAWAAVREPWHPLDREVVLGYASKDEASARRAFPAVAAAARELEALRREGGWPPPGNLGTELDRLGIDGEGRLVLLELKDAAASGVFYAPFQLLQYVHEWAAAYSPVRPALEAVREARIACGLSPASMPHLTEGLRPAIGFAEDTRSGEVRARFEAVRAVVNRYLPPRVAEIEVWAIAGGRAVRVPTPVGPR